MPELVAARASVVVCLATPEALDTVFDGALRVAPDELLVLGPPDSAEMTALDVSRRISGADADAVVLDVSDGWATWTLDGDGARDAFGYLSELDLPEEGFVQGDVAHVPVKVVARPGGLHLLVPAVWGAYLHERILARCPSVTEREEPEDWSP